MLKPYVICLPIAVPVEVLDAFIGQPGGVEEQISNWAEIWAEQTFRDALDYEADLEGIEPLYGVWVETGDFTINDQSDQ